MTAARYEFTPMTTADLPLIRRWLETPHVSEWWHDPAEQFELVSGDLGHPDMAQFIVATEPKPFAYLQCYNIGAWHTGFGPAAGKARAGSISSSARRTCSDRGHGSALIRAFAESLLANGTPRGDRSRSGQRARHPRL